MLSSKEKNIFKSTNVYRRGNINA